MAQDPQAYVDDQGNEYVREGNRWRVIRPGQQAAPAAGGFALQPMVTPAQQMQQERDGRRDALSAQREERMAAAAEATARQAEITATRLAPAEEDQLKAARAAARDALGVMPDLERFSRMNRQQDSGGLMAVPFVDKAFGAFDNEVSQMNEITSRLAPQQRPEGSGTTSDMDLMLYLQASPSVQRPREANDALIQRGRMEGARRAAYADFLDRYAMQNNTLKGADEAFRAAVASGEIKLDQGAPPTVNDGSPLSVAPGTYSGEYVATFDKDGDGVAGYDEMTEAGFTWNQDAGRYDPPGYSLDQGPPPAGPQAPQGGAPQSVGGSNPALQSQIERQNQAEREGLPAPLRMLANGYRDFEAFASGAAEQIPFLDEAAAWAAARLGGDSYEDVRAANADAMQYDRENHGAARNVGGVVGAVAPLAAGGGLAAGSRFGIARAGAGAGRGERLGRFALRGAQNAGIGSATAGVYSAGAAEGGAGERIEAGQNALGLGAALGAAAPYAPRAIGVAGRVADDTLGNVPSRTVNAVGEFAGRQAGRVGNALGIEGSQDLVNRSTGNALRPVVERFADRLGPERVNALAPRAAGYADNAIEPTLIDALDDGGQGMIRAAASRQTPARQQARDFAEGRAAGLQDRVSTQARRTISDDPRAPMEIRAEVSARRSAEGDQAFGAVRGDVIAPEREVIEALRAPALKPAIEEAATAALNRGDSETANMLRQLADGALDNPNGVQITVGMADRLSRSLNGRAETFQRSGNNDAASSYFALAERLRGSARQQVPGYDSALNAYAADSRLMSASELGEQFMSMEADQFAAAIAKLDPEERLIAQAAARRAVERQAGTQGGAPGVAQRLSNGREQAARTTALVGDPAPVQQAMGAELNALRNARNIDPRGGSQTSLNLQDAGGMAGIGGDLATVASRPFSGTLQVITNRLKSRGFNDQEAQQLVEMSIDPARTEEAIAMMSQRMARNRARSSVRAIRHQFLMTSQAGRQQPE